MKKNSDKKPLVSKIKHSEKSPDMYWQAVQLHGQGDLEGAKQSYEEILSKNPNNPDVLHLLGVVLAQQGHKHQAEGFLQKAIRIKDTDYLFYINYGNLLVELNKNEKAIEIYKQALSLGAEEDDLLFKIGVAFQKANLIEEAISYYEKLVSKRSSDAALFSYLGQAWSSLSNRKLAKENFEKALALSPQMEFLYGNWIHSKMYLCDWEGYQESIEKFNSYLGQELPVSAPFIPLSVFDDPWLHKKVAALFSRVFPLNPLLESSINRNKNERIRIGYFSADFNTHAVMWLMSGVFESHDKECFETFAFSFTQGVMDETRLRVSKSFDHFFNVDAKSDDEVARLARSWNIDIAIDLSGYTKNARPGVMSRRAAPIQINFLGYPGTMGAVYYDYIIADQIIIPDESREAYLEKIIYLPSYQPNDDSREVSSRVLVREDFGLPENAFVFCCFNDTYKITPDIFNAWMNILKKVETSVLWLRRPDDVVVENLRMAAIQRGVNSERLVFAEKMQMPSEYLARYGLADLFLDTFPYNAHTTASDALWAGLPVLTRVGKSFASRVAASVLSAIEVPELIVDSDISYEQLAVELAYSPDRLRKIRNRINFNKHESSLFNTKRYTKNLEQAFRAVYERYCRNLPPYHVIIEECNV